MKKILMITVAALLCLGFAMPAMAKVHVGGIVFLDAYYHRWDAEGALGWAGVPGTDDWQQLEIEIPDITRLYGKWTNDDGNVGMHIELGLGNANGAEVQNNSVRLRYAYAWWQITPMFKLTVGQQDQVYSPLLPQQMLGEESGWLHVVGLGFGNIGQGRDPMIRLDIKFNDWIGLAFGMSDPRDGNPAGTYLGGNEENVWPQWSVAIPIHAGPVQIIPSAMWQKQKWDEASANISADSGYMTSVYSLSVAGAFGPFSFAAEGAFGQNWGDMSALLGVTGSEVLLTWNVPFGLYGAMYDNNFNLVDSDNAAFWVQAGFKVGPATIYAVYGWQEEDVYFAVGGQEGEVEFERQMYGISVPIAVAKTFIIRPEFFVYDWDQIDFPSWAGPGADVPLGKEYIGGIQFQIVF